jgi:hypothetical protein
MDKRKVGKYLGPSHDVGQSMCCRILTMNGIEINRIYLVPLSVEDKHSEIAKQKIKEFSDKLTQSLGDRMKGIGPDPEQNEVEEFVPYEDDK